MSGVRGPTTAKSSKAKLSKAAKSASPSLKGPPARERITFQVNRINAKLAQVANRLFRVHGIDVVGARILIYLLEQEERRVGELVDLLALPQSTISHQLQRLHKAKLLRRRRTRVDNRVVAVMLTPAGRLAAQECNAFSLEVHRRMTEHMSERDIRQFNQLLHRMFDILDEVETGQQSGPA